MKVLVTGGAGFIGSHVVEALIGRGDTVTVLDLFDDAYDSALKRSNLAGTRARVVEGDIRDLDCVGDAAAGADVIIHLAARAGVRESLIDPLLYESVNVRGTMVVLEAARLHGARVVFASSSSVYGARGPGAFFEDDGADTPVSPYAATKRAGELVCHAAWAAWGTPVTCLRFFTVYGPRQRPAMAIARFVRLALAGEPLPIFGDGSAVRDFTWVHDAVAGILAAADTPQGYAVVNLGSASPVTLSQVVDAIDAAAGPVTLNYQDEQRGDVPRTHANIDRARALLGWAPTTHTIDGIAKYVAWVRAGAQRGAGQAG